MFLGKLALALVLVPLLFGKLALVPLLFGKLALVPLLFGKLALVALLFGKLALVPRRALVQPEFAFPPEQKGRNI